MNVNGTLVEDKMRRIKGECTHFSFNNCPSFIHDGVSAKFSTNSHETQNIASSFDSYCICSPVVCIPNVNSLNANIFKFKPLN